MLERRQRVLAGKNCEGDQGDMQDKLCSPRIWNARVLVSSWDGDRGHHTIWGPNSDIVRFRTAKVGSGLKAAKRQRPEG